MCDAAQSTMYVGTLIMSLGIPGPCKLLLGVLLWMHGLRSILWIWVGVAPPLTLFAGMYMLPGIPPIYGGESVYSSNPPWSPLGGVISGAAAFAVGMAGVYNVHTPVSDCDHSGTIEQADALCEIRREVIFFDIRSDGDTFWERIVMLVFFGLMIISLLDHFHGRRILKGDLSGATVASTNPTKASGKDVDNLDRGAPQSTTRRECSTTQE
jgi:hypothetical protein